MIEAWQKTTSKICGNCSNKASRLFRGKGISSSAANETASAIEGKVATAFNSSKSRRIVVEEFIDGTKHGATTFIESGKVKFLVTDDERYDYEKYTVSSASIPSSVAKCVEEDLRKSIEAIAVNLNLVDGLFHLQFIINGTVPYIIEVMRRTPGDLYVELIDRLTKNIYSESIIKYFSGCNAEPIPKAPGKFILRQCVHSDQNGIFLGISYSDSIKQNLVKSFVLTKANSFISGVSLIKHAIAIYEFEDSKNMHGTIAGMESFVKVKMEKLYVIEVRTISRFIS